MSNARYRAWVYLALAVLGVLLTLGMACDPVTDITWVNETDEEVEIYFGDELDDFDTSVPPRTSKTVGTSEVVWADVIVIRDREKRVLLRQEITWEELKAQGFRFVITDDMVSPTPTEGR